MVADRLRVGRPDPNVDERDTVAVLSHEVVRRHLVPPPASRRDLRLGILELAALVERAGHREAKIRTVLASQRVDREADEFVNVPDVVGEQHPVLEMLDRRSGIVLQPGEAEIGARRVEQSERTGLGRLLQPKAVRDLVANRHQLVGRKPARQLGRADAAKLDAAFVDDIGIWDFACGAPHRNLHAVIVDQMLKLDRQIFAEQLRPGDGRGIASGLVQASERARGRQSRRRRRRVIVDPELGIGKTALGPRFRIGPGAVLDVERQRLAQVGDRFIKDRAELVDDCFDGLLPWHPRPLGATRLRTQAGARLSARRGREASPAPQAPSRSRRRASSRSAGPGKTPS